jgi:hypothetical protein
MSSENNYTIRDNSSEFAKSLPNNWIEPLTIIARVKGYSGIDEYLLKLIEDKIEQFADTRDNLDVFQEYMHNMIKGKDVPNEWASNNDEEENDIIKKYTSTDLVSKEEVEKRFGKIPPNEEESNSKEEV